MFAFGDVLNPMLHCQIVPVNTHHLHATFNVRHTIWYTMAYHICSHSRVYLLYISHNIYHSTMYVYNKLYEITSIDKVVIETLAISKLISTKLLNTTRGCVVCGVIHGQILHISFIGWNVVCECVCVYNLVGKYRCEAHPFSFAPLPFNAFVRSSKSVDSIRFRRVRTYRIILTFNNKIRMAKLMKLHKSNSIWYYMKCICICTATDEMS